MSERTRAKGYAGEAPADGTGTAPMADPARHPNFAIVPRGPARAERKPAGADPDFSMFEAADIEKPLPATATVAEALTHWRASAGYAALAESTRALSRQAWKRLLATFGACRVRDLTPAWIHTYHAARTKQARRVADIELTELTSLLAHCARHGAIEQNPAREVKKNGGRPRTRYVSDEELAAFLVVCTPWMQAYVGLKTATGARKGQLLALRWSSWNGSELRIPAAKGGRPTAYHGPAIIRALDGVAMAMHGFRPAAAWPNHVDGDRHVVVSERRRTPYLPPNGYRVFSAIWLEAMRRYEAAGGTWFREHDLRAKVASDAPNADAARDLLGHQTTTITDRVYRRRERRVRSHDTTTFQADLFDGTT